MYKFNNTGIFTGYLKQFLATFNLPKVKVYKKEYQEYYNKYNKEHPEVLETITAIKNDNGEIIYPNNVRYIPYLKDDILQEYIDGKWQYVGYRSHQTFGHLHHYNYGSKILNYTKNLKLQNNIYDSYTHEYLGNYLRFYRDYSGINLMSLYNCFSNRACENLHLKWKYSTTEQQGDETTIISQTFSFDSDDESYKIYMLPVNLFQTYTVAINSESPVEMCCGIYGDYPDPRDKFKDLPRLTYKRVSQSLFSAPFLYDLLTYDKLRSLINSTLAMELLQNEGDLKLFIKVPKTNNSSIVVLEGDYLGWNDRKFSKLQAEIININCYGEGEPLNIEIPTTQTEYTYLDILNNNLYKAAKDFKENTCWINCGPLWNKAVFEVAATDPTNTPKSLYTLHVDEKTYTLPASTQKLIDEHKISQIEAYFTYYRFNYETNVEDNIKKPLSKYSAYFNTNTNQLLLNPTEDWILNTNHRVINLENLNNKLDIILSSPLQLLQMNTKEQHPFADRLVEYLLENAITSDSDEVAENIKRTQKVLKANTSESGYMPKVYGAWDSDMNKVIYEYMTTKRNTAAVNHDLLGYVDKDVEKYYSTTKFIIDPYTKQSKKVNISILNTELDEEGN